MQRSQLEQERQKSEKAKQELQSQEVLRTKSLAERRKGLYSIEQRQRGISQRGEELSQSEEEIVQQEERIAQIQQAEAEYRQEQSAYQSALGLFNAEVPVPVSQLPSRVRYYYEQLIQGKDASAQLNAKLTSIQEGRTTLEQEFTPSQIKGLEAEQIITYKEVPAETLTVPMQNVLVKKDLNINVPSVSNVTNVSAGVSDRDSRSFLKNLWSGVGNTIGGVSDYKAGNEKAQTITLGNSTFAIATAQPVKETISVNPITGEVGRKVLVDITNKPKSFYSSVVSPVVSAPYKYVSEGMSRLLFGDPKNLPVVGTKLGEVVRKIIPKQEEFKEITIPEQKIALPYQKRGTSYFGSQGYYSPETITPSRKETVRTVVGYIPSVAGGLAYTPLFFTPLAPIVEGYFAIEGTKTALNPEATFEERILGAGVAGLSLFGLGRGTYKSLTKPITKTIGKTETLFTAENIIQPIEGGMERGRFILKARTITPKIEETTRIRDWLGMKPKNIIQPKITTYVSYTPFDIITKEGEIIQPANIITKRIGAKYGLVSSISGESTPITLEAFSKLPKNQQLIFQKLAEQKAGVPVKMEFVPNILGKDLELSTRVVQLTKRVRITPSKGLEGFKRLPKTSTGRTISVSETGTIAREIPVPEGTPFKLYVYRTGSKDITMPFSRATGNVPIVRGRSVILEARKPVEGTSQTTIQVLKLSPKSIETIRKIEVAAAKSISKPRIPKPIKPLDLDLPIPVITRDTATIGKGVARTEIITVQNIPAQEIKMDLQPVLISRQENNQRNVQEEENILRTNQREVQILKPSSTQIELLKPKQQLKQYAEQILNLKQETKQIQKIQSKQIARTQQVFRKPTITPKIKPPVIIPKVSQSSKQKLISIAQGIEEYEVFTKKYGKEVSLGEFESIGKASKTLKTELIGTLRASGFVVQKSTGLKVPLSRLDLGYQFTPSKVNQFVAVQKRSFRLGAGGERTEILRARKSKSRNKWI